MFRPPLVVACFLAGVVGSNEEVGYAGLANVDVRELILRLGGELTWRTDYV